MSFSLVRSLKEAGRTVLRNPMILFPAALQAALPLLYAAVFKVAVTAIHTTPVEFQAYTYKGPKGALMAYFLFILLDILITVGFITMLKQTFSGRARLRDFFAGIWRYAVRFVLSIWLPVIIVFICYFLILSLLAHMPVFLRLIAGLPIIVIAVSLFQIWVASFVFEGAKPITAPLERAYSFVKGYFPYLLVPSLLHLIIGMLQPVLWSYVSDGLRIGSYYLVVAAADTAVFTNPAVVICCLALHIIWRVIVTLWFFGIYYNFKLEVNALEYKELASSDVQLAQ